ncbi:MAG: 50S ribosomal protein L9 [Spirochaetia bacterium]|nr:50S ribosomal protein L9 [Spirochaetia bacterium]
MKVILKKDVANLGRAGDIKEVKNGYARNFLLPNGFVMPATSRSEKERIYLEKVQKLKVKKRKKTAEESATAVKNKEIVITMKTGEEGKLFGSVTSLHIQKELEKIGFEIDKKSIVLDSPIKNLGKYKINIKLYEGISSQINLTVQDEDGNIEVKKEIKEEEKETNKAAEENITEAISEEKKSDEQPENKIEEKPEE